MKIILIANDINEESVEEMATPLGLCYLAGFMAKYFPEKVDFELKTALNYNPDNDADLIGISSMSRYFPRAVELAEKIKARRQVPILIGGCHISALPHSLPDCFDLGVIGEGEQTFRELLTVFQEKKQFLPKELKKIPGIAYHGVGEGEGVILTPARPLISTLEQIPFPRRDLWEITPERVKWISSSRGCPFGCIFCALAKSRHRSFPADYVVNEIIYLKEHYNPNLIVFQDDLFMLNRERIREIIAQMRAKGIKEDTRFGVSLRADLIDEETVELLKQLNTAIVYMGLESGSERVLNYLKSGSLKLAQVESALDLLSKNRIKVEGSFILGSPRESREDLLATYNFIYDSYKSRKLDYIALCMLTPYPGSKVWEYARGRGLVSEDMDFSRLTLTLSNFDPYRSIYLNEIIPLEEFLDYLELFEDLLFSINQPIYDSLKPASRDLFYRKRLDRERLLHFKQKKAKKPGS